MLTLKKNRHTHEHMRRSEIHKFRGKKKCLNIQSRVKKLSLTHGLATLELAKTACPQSQHLGYQNGSK